MSTDGGRREFCAWLTTDSGAIEAAGVVTETLQPTLGEPIGPEVLQRTSPRFAVRIDWSEPEGATANRVYRPFDGGFTIRAVTSGGAERDIDVPSEYGGGLSGAEPLRLVDLDGDGDPEAIIRWYSGGAHCCTKAVIVDPLAGGAYIDVTRADFADAGYSLRNLRGAGTEIISADARFAYALSSYAASRFPLKVYRLVGGRLRDVTGSYPQMLRRDQRKHLADYRSIARSFGPREARCALAAFIADGRRLGRGRAAWAVARRELSRAGDPAGAAPIRRLLRRLGY